MRIHERGRCYRSLIAFVAVLLVGSLGRAAAEPVTTIRSGGDPANRVDMVFLGDGYTAGQLARYAADVERFVSALFAAEPFREYQRYFNVHRIDVQSQQSGADHPERVPPIFRNTALDATFNCQNLVRLVCVNRSKINDVLVRSISSPAMRDRGVVVVIVNDTQYGGSGGEFAVTSLDPNAAEIAIHELGHSFGLLADEYGASPPIVCNAAVEPSPPNATRETQRARIKWRAWIDAGTLIPTPGSAPGVPGLYVGANYCDIGLFRPTFDSKMRSLGRPFEQINSEQLVKRIYAVVSLIDAVEPADPAVKLIEGEGRTFRVSTQQPLTHDLDIVWSVDGQPRGTGREFTLPALAPGTHTVEVRVRDQTPLVRDDPTQALSDTATWTVTVARLKAGIVNQLSGSASGVGRGRERTGIAMVGTFVVEGPVDLALVPATADLTSVFNAVGRGGEIVQGLPVSLVGDPRNNEKTAVFKSAPGVLPVVRLTIGAKGRGTFTFRLEVTQATSIPPSQCALTTLTTTFLLRGAANPVRVSTAQPWECFGAGSQYRRLP